MRPRVTSIGLILLSRPARQFIYPTHIDRASLDALPAKPGVYFFRNEHGEPVYIGKSVNIRSRVLAHLRTPEEAAMLEASRQVDFRQTAGEIGALLLESRLVKQHQPLYNIRLKDMTAPLALHLREGDTRPQAVGFNEVDADETAFLYGMFSSQHAVQESLRALARRHGLCPALLGLESTTHGRACFSHQLGQCRGACVGKESRAQHAQRLRSALNQLNTTVWPYAGPIGIVETEERWRQVHVIDRWAYIGTLEGRRKQIRRPARMGLDMDIYKILVKPLAEDRLTIVQCSMKSGRNGIEYANLPEPSALKTRRNT